MYYLYAVILIIVNAGCVFLSLFGIPGNWLIVTLTILFAFWQKTPEQLPVSIPVMICLTALALLGEVAEFTLGVMTAKKAGAKKSGMIGAFLGAFAGAILGTLLIPIPILGSLIGLGLGAALGSIILERASGTQAPQAVKTAVAAGLGTVSGTFIKFTCGVLICLVAAVALLVS